MVCYVFTMACVLGEDSDPQEATVASCGAKAVNNIRVSGYLNRGENRQCIQHAPKKIVVVGASETQMLLDFGVADRIVAAELWYDRDVFFRKSQSHLLQRIPDMKGGAGSLEYVLMQEPDLFVAQQCVFTPQRYRSTDFWNRRGVVTMVPLNTNNPSKHVERETIAKELGFIKDMGTVLGKEERARRFADDVEDTIRYVSGVSHNHHHPTVLVVEQFGDGIACYSQRKLAGDMVRKLGGQVADMPPMIDYETLLMANPEVLFIVCSAGGEKTAVRNFLRHPLMSHLSAVKNNRVYAIPLEFVYSPETRLKDGLLMIAAGLYPEIRSELVRRENNQ